MIIYLLRKGDSDRMSRNRIGASGRSIVGYPGRKLGGYPLSHIADYFRRDPVSLCQGVEKVERRMRKETPGAGKQSGPGPQNKNKEITKSDPIFLLTVEEKRHFFYPLISFISC